MAPTYHQKVTANSSRPIGVKMSRLAQAAIVVLIVHLGFISVRIIFFRLSLFQKILVYVFATRFICSWLKQLKE